MKLSVNHRGRIFPDLQWSEAEKTRRIAEREDFHQRCRAIFNRVYSQLIQEHYQKCQVKTPPKNTLKNAHI